MNTKIDFTYLSEPDMIAAGVLDAARCVDVCEETFSLLGKGEALITQLARAMHHGNISERKQRHTRRVTVAWTLFFLINALISAILWTFAPAALWSIFANLLSMPLLAAMFVGEHFWRIRVLPPEERPSFAQIVRAYHMHGKQKPPATP